MYLIFHISLLTPEVVMLVLIVAVRAPLFLACLDVLLYAHVCTLCTLSNHSIQRGR